ncbi:MAG: RNA polymerase sigma factor [Fimbriimonadales bacterium]|nr:RNA polymerase sigma factor [Fimbriimonadales bacterium]
MQYTERCFATEYAEQQFFASLRPRIERMVRRYVHGSDDDVEDLTQECLIKIYSSLEQLRDSDKLDPWLQALVRNTVFTWMRERRRELEMCSLGLESDTEAEPCASYEDDTLLYMVLQQVLQSLSEEDRRMIEMRYGDGMRYHEIAKVMRLNVETVRKRINRALAKLRAHPIVRAITEEAG